MTDTLITAHEGHHHKTQDANRLARMPVLAAAGILALSAMTSCGTGQSTVGATSGATSVTSPSMPSSPSMSSMSSMSSMPHAAAMIHISSFKYAAPPTVAPGATVSVMNMDGENHTVTADSGNAFDVRAIAGTTVTFTAPNKPGTYPFHCAYHSNMHGVLVVK